MSLPVKIFWLSADVPQYSEAVLYYVLLVSGSETKLEKYIKHINKSVLLLGNKI
jgi:hypothetical protein